MHSWPYSSLRPRAWEELQVHTVYRGQQWRLKIKTLLWDFNANVKSEWSYSSTLTYAFMACTRIALSLLYSLLMQENGTYMDGTLSQNYYSLKVTFSILYSSSSLYTGDEIPCIIWRYKIPETWKFVPIISYTFDHDCYYIGNWQFSRYLNWFFSEYLNMHFK